MKLNLRQLKGFNDQGYLFLPSCFSDEEVAVLRSEAEAIYKTDRQEVWRETTGAPRTAFAAHTYNEAFRLLSRHPRLVEPLRQLFGEEVYVHQFKINAKAAFEGAVWQWHQDYGTWARDDGMPEPRAMNIAVFLFLDEVMPINGPLMFIRRATRPEHSRLDMTPRPPPTPCGRSTTTRWRGWCARRSPATAGPALSRRPASLARC